MHRESFNLRLWVKTGLYRSAYSRVEWQDEDFSLILVEPTTEEIIAMATLNTPGVVFEKGDVLRVRSGEQMVTHTIDSPPRKPIRFNFNDRILIPEEGPSG